MDIDAVEKHQQKMREIAQKRWEKFNEQQQLNGGGAAAGAGSARLLLNNNEKWKSRTMGLFLPLRAKQIFFILNGNPGRIYRVIINPYRKFDFDTILEEVSHGLGIAILKLYSFTGERIKNIEELFDIKENRVLAVPRHERPIFPTGIQKESSASSIASAVITSSLPPINRSNLFHHPSNNRILGRTTTTHYALKLPPRQTMALRNNHSIERSPIGRDSRIPGVTAAAAAAIAPARRTFSYHKPPEAGAAGAGATRPFIPQMASTSRTRIAPPIQPFSKRAQNRRVMSLKPRRTLPYQQANRAGLPTTTLLAASAATKSSSATSKDSSTASASLEENDSDSGRPRSTDFEEATEEDPSESDSDNALRYEEEESDDDDYPDVHMDILSENDSLESPPPSRASNASRSPPDTAAQTPGSTRPPSAASQIFAIQNNDKRRDDAATTIQSHIRGHLTRKKIKPLLGAGTVGSGATAESESEEDKDNAEAAKEEEEERMMAESESEPEEEEYDDEDLGEEEDIPINDGRRNAAAVTIQAHVRGHLTRKRIKRPGTPGATTAFIVDGEDEEGGENKVVEQHFNDDYSEAEQSEHSDANSEVGRLESESEAEQSEYDDLPDEIDDDEIGKKHQAATVIQKNWKGFYVRKNLDKIVPTRLALPSEEGEAFGESFENEDEEIRLETAAPAGEPDEIINSETGFTYTAAIFTGNRWAADTESDLYIILYGDKGESEKHFLRQDSDDPKFKQGKTDEFVISTQNLGQLRKVTIGHDHQGYGGGVFIDQIIITENSEEESKRYLFQCYKWFDSGQVDGKLDRT
uniref:Uncharacterized protein n=1 Tax=Panagrolaimus superbus TaxID=310955 RepID=A0A914YD55_9BILA